MLSSLLLVLQTPILVFPVLVNTSACVTQELTQRPLPESGFVSDPVPLPLEQSLVLQMKIFKAPGPVLESVCPGVCPAYRTLGGGFVPHVRVPAEALV